MRRKHLAVLTAVLLLEAAIGFADVVVTPQTLLPHIVYAIPILISAYAVDPRSAALVTAWSIAVEGLAAILQSVSITEWPFQSLSLALIGTFGVLIAVKNQKQQELGRERQGLLEHLQQEAAELRSVISSIRDGVAVYDPNGVILHINPAALRILGYSEEDAAKPIDQRPHPRMRNADNRELSRDERPSSMALRGQLVTNEIIAIQTHDAKSLWVSASAAPLKNDDGNLFGAVASFTDITPLHDLQEQLRDVLRAVSHDLRNPLTVIQGNAELLEQTLEKAAIAELEREMAAAISAGARRMNTMIQDLVDSARQESGQLRLNRKPVNLTDEVRRVKASMGTSDDIERIEVEMDKDLPTVSADPDRLERIMVNLLTNALKYSKPGSKIRVKGASIGNQVTVSVADQGVGIAQEDLPHVFERFYTSKGAKKPESTGLGLYITRTLVEAHGGRIWVESKPNRGSIFSLTLPVA